MKGRCSHVEFLWVDLVHVAAEFRPPRFTLHVALYPSSQLISLNTCTKSDESMQDEHVKRTANFTSSR